MRTIFFTSSLVKLLPMSDVCIALIADAPFKI
jgi:hypothetical protein